MRKNRMAKGYDREGYAGEAMMGGGNTGKMQVHCTTMLDICKKNDSAKKKK